MTDELIERLARAFARHFAADKSPALGRDPSYPLNDLLPHVKRRIMDGTRDALAALKTGDKIPPEGLTVAPTDYFDRLYEENKVAVARQAKEDMRERCAKALEASLLPKPTSDAAAELIRALEVKDE
jgi:hypothetical protein